MDQTLAPDEKIVIYRKSGYVYWSGPIEGLPEEKYQQRESYFATVYSWEEANRVMSMYQALDDTTHALLSERANGSVFNSWYRAMAVPESFNEFEYICQPVIQVVDLYSVLS